MRKLEERELEKMRLPKAYWSLDPLHGTIWIPSRPDVPFEPTEAFSLRYVTQIAKTWPKFSDTALLVYGPPGAGKSSLLAKMLVSLRGSVSSTKALYVPMHRLIEASRDKIPFDAEMSLWERMETCDFLVIDEIRDYDAKDRYGVASDPILHRLFFERKAARRMTWLGTHMPPHLLKDPYPLLHGLIGSYLHCIQLNYTLNLYERYSREALSLLVP